MVWVGYVSVCCARASVDVCVHGCVCQPSHENKPALRAPATLDGGCVFALVLLLLLDTIARVNAALCCSACTCADCNARVFAVGMDAQERWTFTEQARCPLTAER